MAPIRAKTAVYERKKGRPEENYPPGPGCRFTCPGSRRPCSRSGSTTSRIYRHSRRRSNPSPFSSACLSFEQMLQQQTSASVKEKRLYASWEISFLTLLLQSTKFARGFSDSPQRHHLFNRQETSKSEIPGRGCSGEAPYPLFHPRAGWQKPCPHSRPEQAKSQPDRPSAPWPSHRPGIRPAASHSGSNSRHSRFGQLGTALSSPWHSRPSQSDNAVCTALSPPSPPRTSPGP